MKKLFALLLALALVLSVVPALGATYLGFYNQVGDEPTLEWLEDAHQSAPAAVAQFYHNSTKALIPNQLLDDYPAQTAVVYRTANYFGGQTAVRNDTAIIVLTEEKFDSLDAAKAYLDNLGLIDLIDSVIGSVVLVTPADGAAFGEADLTNFYNLHDAMFNQNTAQKVGDDSYTAADGAYYGAYGKVYMIAFDGAATFVNNYVAPGRFDVIGRYAGILLVGGDMNADVVVTDYVPVYLANASEAALNAYLTVDGAELIAEDDAKTVYANPEVELCKVIVAKDASNLKALVEDAFYSLFMQAQRLKVVRSADQVAGYELQYTDELEAPAVQLYALSPRNAIINGVTLDGGLSVVKHYSEQFSDIKTVDGEYLQCWYEALPMEVLDNTAEAQSIPLVLALHGTQDDPLMFMDEIGWLEVAGQENIAIVDPFTEGCVISYDYDAEGNFVGVIDAIMKEALPALVNYMLETYPALDPARVYVSGYSMGGGSTYRAVYGANSMFAAAAPMAGMHSGMLYNDAANIKPDPADAEALKAVGMPTMILTSTYDLGFVQAEGRLIDNTLLTVDQFLLINDMPTQEYDFEKYPIIGMETSDFALTLTYGEYRNFQWTIDNEDGVPMVAVNVIENPTHALYPGHAAAAYDYMKQFSRDLETGAVIYTPAE